MSKAQIWMYMTFFMVILGLFIAIVPLNMGVTSETRSAKLGPSSSGSLDIFKDKDSKAESSTSQFTIIKNIEILGAWNLILVVFGIIYVYLTIGLVKDLVNPLVQS